MMPNSYAQSSIERYGDDDDKYAKHAPFKRIPEIYPDSQYEDKYAKHASSKCTPGSFQKYSAAFALLEDMGKQYPMILGFVCFAVCSGCAYNAMGRPINGDQIGRFLSSNFEILGLLFL